MFLRCLLYHKHLLSPAARLAVVECSQWLFYFVSLFYNKNHKKIIPVLAAYCVPGVPVTLPQAVLPTTCKKVRHGHFWNRVGQGRATHGHRNQHTDMAISTELVKLKSFRFGCLHLFWSKGAAEAGS